MKVGCEKCGAQYDLDDARIPASGMMMKCPACLHQFKVVKASGAPPAKREIALSPMHDREDPTPLPDDAPGMVPPDEIDLPAPVARPSLAGPNPPTKPAIEVEPTRDDAALAIDIDTDEPDLPAPVMRKIAPPVPVAPHSQADDDLIDLPAPKAAAPPTIPAPRVAPPTIPTPRVAPPTIPMPPAVHDDVIDLPAPKYGAPRPATHEEADDLLAPKRPSIGLDMDAPDPEDAHISLPHKPPRLGNLGEEPGADGETIDLLAPKQSSETPDLPAPKKRSGTVEEPDLLAPKAASPSVTAEETLDRSDRSLDDPTPVESQKYEAPKAQAPAAEDEDEKRPRRGWVKPVVAVGAVALVIGGVGVGLGAFTSSGYFGMNLWSGKHRESEARLMAARKLLSDDTPASYRKAALDLHGALETDEHNVEAIALEARARLQLVRLGVASEQKAAEQLLQRPDATVGASAEIEKSQALRLLVSGKIGEARSKLNGVLSSAPADAAALELAGFTELAAGDAAAADKAFAKALASEPARAAALYGDGVAKERLGDRKGASELYTRVLARSPTHFGATVGAARLGEAKDAAAKIDELIAKRAAAAAPRELADAWTTLGLIAQQAGRRDEAEDRLKRAVALDASSTVARVALANVQCDAGRCADALEPLGRIVGAEPKNLDARLALARAQLDTGRHDEAVMTVQPISSVKDARVSFLVGRTQLGAATADREKAVAAFKEAIALDPKLIDAYLALSAVLSQLGRADEALEALKQAEAKTSDDPQLMLQLGRAYLGLAKPADAEARFRAALTASPELADAHIALGMALEAESKLDDAQKEYDAVAKATPDAPGLAERMARLAVKQGKKDAAWALFSKALGQGLPTHSLRLAAAELALDTGRVADATKLAGEVLKEDERSAPAHLAMARAHLAGGHEEEALIEARRAAVLADLPEAHFTLAQVLERLNKLDQAVSEYNLARRGSTESEASLGHARIMVRMGASRDALAELATLTKIPPLKARALLLTGDCYTDLNQADRARKAYEDAVKADPASGEIAFKLGRVYNDAGKRKPAADMFERAVKLAGDKNAAPWVAEAWLLDGDVHREQHESAQAVKAYQKYLELAPPDAPARREVQKHLSVLGAQ